MVDSIGMYNGLNFKKGAREPTYYDLGAEGGMLTNTDYNSMGIDSMHDKLRQEQPKPVAMFDKAFNRSSSMMVMPIKSEFDAVILWVKLKVIEMQVYKHHQVMQEIN